MATWNIYIDEAGDEGFKIYPEFIGGAGSSRWFIVAAVIVAAEDDRKVASSLNRIKARLWPTAPQHSTSLHWRKLKHDRKRVVLNELRSEQFTWMAVAFEKCHPKFDRSKFDIQLVRQRRPDLKSPMYNYATRFLFERLSRYAKRTNRDLNVTFENRASLSVSDISTYLGMLTSYPGPYGTPTIAPEMIAKYRAETKGNSKLLQLADVCAGAVNNALEPNQYGDVEDYYIKRLAPKLDRVDNKLWGYGIKLFPGTYDDCIARVPAYSWMADL